MEMLGEEGESLSLTDAVTHHTTLTTNIGVVGAGVGVSSTCRESQSPSILSQSSSGQTSAGHAQLVLNYSFHRHLSVMLFSALWTNYLLRDRREGTGVLRRTYFFGKGGLGVPYSSKEVDG